MVAANGTVTASESALEVIEGHEQSTSKTLARIVEELTELRDSEQRLVDELTRRAGEARTRCAGYDKAIGALGGKDKRGPATSAPAKRKARGALNDGQLLLAVRYISEQTTGDTGAAKLVQREWRFGHARR